MKLQDVLRKIDAVPSRTDMTQMQNEVNRFVELMKNEIALQKIDADLFIGGSFAKKTLVKSDNYDVDVFVRFSWKYTSLSELLEKIVSRVAHQSRASYTHLHGSRDYFRIMHDDKLMFEIIPITRIQKPEQARNVTDLSYFHVGYMQRHLTQKMKREIALAKKFCKAHNVYGAESYIGGFSGYALECLILEYKSFAAMIRKLTKIPIGERLILDPAQHYRHKRGVFLELNESKLQSPIILIDPTWKERNVLAALEHESLIKFQKASRTLLARPSTTSFVLRKLDEAKLSQIAQTKKAELVKIVISTDRQEGDIAGTKLKKFSRFLRKEMHVFFEVLVNEFWYEGGKRANAYFIARKRKEVLRKGPPITMKKQVTAFKKKHPRQTSIQKGHVYAKLRVPKNLRTWTKLFIKTEKSTINEMGIVRIALPE